MEVIILTAGEGKRMQPLTYTRPKAMLPLANRPLMEYILVRCRNIGLTEFVIVTGYKAAIIKNYFGDGKGWNVNIKYVDQEKQMGTGDALNKVKDYVSNRFLLMNGDILISQADLGRIIRKNGMSMSLFPLDNVSHLGVVEVENNKVKNIFEKVKNPPTNLVNAGMYLLTKDIFSAIENTPPSSRGEFELTDSLQYLINNGISISPLILEYWYDMSYPWQLLDVNEKVIEESDFENAGTIEPGVTVKGKLSVGKNTTIKSGTYIEGPVVIGNNCTIGPNCFIRGNTSIGHQCHVGASVEIKNSIIMDHTNIPHLSYVGDSIIGEGCNLGAGTKIANLRLDKENIEIKGIDTGKRKLGVIMGDNVQTGINVSINIGTMIGNESRIGPGLFISGVVPPFSSLLPTKANFKKNTG